MLIKLIKVGKVTWAIWPYRKLLFLTMMKSINPRISLPWRGSRARGMGSNLGVATNLPVYMYEYIGITQNRTSGINFSTIVIHVQLEKIKTKLVIWA